MEQLKRDKYNPDNPFLKNNTTTLPNYQKTAPQQTTQNLSTSLIERKTSFISRIFDKIKSFFKHNK